MENKDPQIDSRFRSLHVGIRWNLVNSIGNITSKLLRGAVVPKVLDPASYGLFASMGIFTRYLQFADFGAAAYFSKVLPHARFYQGEAEERRHANRAYSLVLLSNLLVILGLGALAICYTGTQQDFYKLALLLIPITIAAKLKELHIAYALGVQNYRKAATASVINNYLSMVLVVGGVFAYGAIGGVVGMLFSEVFLCWYIGKSTGTKFHFFFGRELLHEWRGTLRIFALTITETVAATIDQIFILKVFDARGLGLYGLGLTFAWAMEALGEVFTNTAYPKLMALGKENPRAASSFFQHTLYCYLLASLVAVPVLVWIIEVAVAVYFDRYAEGLGVYSAMIFLGLSRGVVTLTRRAYVALDMEGAYIANTLLSIGLNALGLAWAWNQNFSFAEVIHVILAVNTIALVVFLVRLSKFSDYLFWKNLALILLVLGLLLTYAVWVRPEVGSEFELISQVGVMALALVMALGLAYRERDLLREYLK